MEVEGGRGRHRGIWLCAPRGLAPSSSCPRPPSWGSLWPCQGQGDGAKRSADGAPRGGCWWGSILPHLPTSLMGQGRLPLQARRGRAPASSCPAGPAVGAAAWTARTVVLGAESASLCGRRAGRRPGHRSPRPRRVLKQRRRSPGPTRRGGVGKTGRGGALGGPESSPGRTRPPAARDQQVITLQLQGERPRKGQSSSTGGTASAPWAETVAPHLATPSRPCVRSCRLMGSPRQHGPWCPGRAGGWGRGGRGLALATFVPFWILNHMNVLPSQKNK